MSLGSVLKVVLSFLAKGAAFALSFGKLAFAFVSQPVILAGLLVLGLIYAVSKSFRGDVNTDVDKLKDAAQGAAAGFVSGLKSGYDEPVTPSTPASTTSTSSTTTKAGTVTTVNK